MLLLGDSLFHPSFECSCLLIQAVFKTFFQVSMHFCFFLRSQTAERVVIAREGAVLLSQQSINTKWDSLYKIFHFIPPCWCFSTFFCNKPSFPKVSEFTSKSALVRFKAVNGSFYWRIVKFTSVKRKSREALKTWLYLRGIWLSFIEDFTETGNSFLKGYDDHDAEVWANLTKNVQ